MKGTKMKIKQLIVGVSALLFSYSAIASVYCTWSETGGITPSVIPGKAVASSYLYHFDYVEWYEAHMTNIKAKYTLMLDEGETAHINLKEEGKYSSIHFYCLPTSANPSALNLYSYASLGVDFTMSNAMTYEFDIVCEKSQAGKYVYSFYTVSGLKIGNFSTVDKGVLVCLEAGDNYDGRIFYVLSCDVRKATLAVISLIPQGGELSTTRVFRDAGQQYGDLPIPQRSNYTFAGWFVNSNCTGTPVKSTDVVPEGGISLYAGWIPDVIDVVQVVFDKRNGTGGSDSVYVMYGEEMPNATAPSRAGYEFVGYFDSSFGGTQYYDAEMNGVTTWDRYEDTLLYAQWKVLTYPVTYLPGANGCGDSVVETKKHTTGLVLKGAIFTREHYVQTGWSTSESGEKVYELGATYTENHLLTLYPYWEIDKDAPAWIESISVAPHSSIGGKLDIDINAFNVLPGNKVKIVATVDDEEIPVATLNYDGGFVDNGAIEIKEGKNRIVWHSAKDIPNAVIEDVQIKVSVEQTITKKLSNPEYLVVDMSAGKCTFGYPPKGDFPISYLDAVPSGGWTDEYKTTKMVFKLIRAGQDPLGRYTLTRDFYIGVFEVTQKQWLQFYGLWRGPYAPSSTYGLGDTYPAYFVAMMDIWEVQDCLNARTGVKANQFELPTEAEWEYACRAGTTTKYSNGDLDSKLSEVALWNEKSIALPSAKHTLKPVGQRNPNGWGLYDMHGSVMEWTKPYYSSSAPSGIDPWVSDGTEAAIKGGSWAVINADACASSTRSSGSVMSTPKRTYQLGFRFAFHPEDRFETREENDEVEIHGIALDLRAASEAIPSLGDDPGSKEVAEALDGSTDANLLNNIFTVEEYNDYRSWAGAVKTAAGRKAGYFAVRNSPCSWLSYALNSGVLLSQAPQQEDVKIEEFAPNLGNEGFDFAVSIKNVEVGSGALVENLKKVVGVEGASSLDVEAFSPDHVELEFSTPEDGMLKFKVRPKGEPEAFFMRTKLKVK